MSLNTDAARAVASVRDILSRQENLPRIRARLAAPCAAQELLSDNPPQPRKLLRPSLEGRLATIRFTYPDGSTAILQHQVPDPDNPNAACHVRTWVERSRPSM